MIEFPTLEAGQACFQSKEYDQAARHRRECGAGEVDLPSPDAGEVQVAQSAIALNYMDFYERSGAYTMALPLF